jgi:hypothetical protein
LLRHNNASLLLCLWSLWRRYALTTRLLLHWSNRTFGLCSTSGTFSALLALRVSYTALRLLNTTRLFHWSRLFNGTRLFHRLLLLCRLRRCTAARTLVSHLELLLLGAIRRRIHTHCLRQIWTERRRYRRRAGDHCRITQFARDSRRNVDLAATPR